MAGYQNKLFFNHHTRNHLTLWNAFVNVPVNILGDPHQCSAGDQNATSTYGGQRHEQRTKNKSERERGGDTGKGWGMDIYIYICVCVCVCVCTYRSMDGCVYIHLKCQQGTAGEVSETTKILLFISVLFCSLTC